jgi:D-alanine-D-alanine ligase
MVAAKSTQRAMPWTPPGAHLWPTTRTDPITSMASPLIAVFRGGLSGESVISHQSAARMMDALDPARFDAVFITIAPAGWSCETRTGGACALHREDLSVDRGRGREKVAAALIAIHGTPGEDGLLQGYLDLLGVPCQTGDTLNMAATFSKSTTVAMLRQLGFPVAPSVPVSRTMPDAVERAARVGFPCFVKADRSGSSLGVSKVKHPGELPAALEAAFAVSAVALVEAGVTGRELTCGVMRLDGRIVALPVCEVRTSREFFDYEAKYHANDTQELLPAPLPEEVAQLVRERSAAIYEAMDCRGMVRVDHFWTGGELVTIELNTVPGFSAASIFPKMLETAGIGVPRAMEALVHDMLHGHSPRP